jgi:hypothetical protein
MSVRDVVKRISLAYRDLAEIPQEIISEHSPAVEELDLSNNKIK